MHSGIPDAEGLQGTVAAGVSRAPVLATWSIRSKNELFKEQVTTAPLLLADDFDTRVQSEGSNTFILFRQ